MAQDTPHRLRVDRATVTQFLDRLDAQNRRTDGIDLRGSERFSYRPETTTIEIAQGEEASAFYATAARNISRGGMGIITGQFVYPGTVCRVSLESPQGTTGWTSGRVVRCRYLIGSPSLHEVGVQFDRPVDVELFADLARVRQILLVDPEPTTRRLFASFLQPFKVELSWATNSLDAATEALTRDFDLLLIDLESHDINAFVVVRELRNAGYLGPVIGMALDSGHDLRKRCHRAGCTGFLRKPITRDALRTLVDSLNHRPVLSTLTNDITMAPLIDQFVAGLRARAKRLSAACEQQDTRTVQRLARSLRGDAGSYGFEEITDAAEHVEILTGLHASMDRLRPAVYELVHMCLLARPAGHEGPSGLYGDPGPFSEDEAPWDLK